MKMDFCNERKLYCVREVFSVIIGRRFYMNFRLPKEQFLVGIFWDNANAYLLGNKVFIMTI